MLQSERPDDTEVTTIGNKVCMKIRVAGRDEPVTIWMGERTVARFVLQLQVGLREMNGKTPLPDHPGWQDA